MIEHGGCVEEDLEEKDGIGGGPRAATAAILIHREEDLDRMKASAGREIEVEVRMMHHVEPPEEGYGVEHHMLQIDHEIEENDPTDHFHPEGRGYAFSNPHPCSPVFTAIANGRAANSSRTSVVSKARIPGLPANESPWRRSADGGGPPSPKPPLQTTPQ